MGKRVAELFTRRTSDGSLDEGAVAESAEACAAQGADALLILGAFGEQGRATASEQERLAALCHEAIRGRARLLAGVFETASTRAIERILSLSRHGEMGFVVTPSFHFGLSNPQELARHFSTIHSATKAQILYMHFPALTRVQPDAGGWSLLGDSKVVTGAMIMEDSLSRRGEILRTLSGLSLPCWIPTLGTMKGAACVWEEGDDE